LIIDDVQWFDRLSTRALGFIAHRISATQIGLLMASRLELDGYVEDYGMPTYEVPPLLRSDSSELVESVFPSLSPAVRERILLEAQGNPLALLELPTALTGAQKSTAGALPSLLPLTRRLQLMFEHRIAALPESTRRLLLLAGLDGTGDLSVLAATESLDKTLECLSPAELGRLIHIDNRARKLLFRHPLIKSAVAERASSNEICDCHLTLARLLLDQPERRAWHLAEAAIEPDDEIAELLERVARQIQRRGDALGAVSAMIRAAELSPEASDRSRRLAEAAYLGMTGELRDISQLLKDAMASELDGSGNLYAAATGAYVLLNGDGDVNTAHSLLVAALAGHSDQDGETTGAFTDALRALSLVCQQSSSREHWEGFDNAVARLRPHVPPDLVLLGTTLANPTYASPHDLTLLDTSISHLRNEQDPWRVTAIGAAAMWMDRLSGCRDPILRVVRDARDGGSIGQAINCILFLCQDDYLAGRWEDCLAFADEGARLCVEFGYNVSAWVYWLYPAYIKACRGDYRGADELCDRTLQWAIPRGVGIAISAVHSVRALAALSSGDFEESFRHLSAISAPGTLEPYAPLALWTMLDLVEVSIRTKRYREARAHVETMREVVVRNLSPRTDLMATASEALITPDESARAVFERALEIPGIPQWPFSVARVQLLYGERLRRMRSPAEARTHLSEALDVFQSLGASPWVERATTELRATGQVTRRASSRTALTPQEEEVARLAASGLTNKEIGERLYLSHRTVMAHLYRIFPELGITSRAALRDALGPP
jgi:DNA-binding CsgD family transcriptional regulator